MNDLPNIEQEFLEENKSNLSQFVPKSRRGPYSKQDKEKRRNEVYRLHFDYGYSARKISELTKISRNTINADIDFWYFRMLSKTNALEPENIVLLNLMKMEEQRARIREYLDKTESFQDKLSIERLLLDIDTRINNTYQRLGESTKRIFDIVTKEINRMAKENNLPYGFNTLFSLMTVSKKAQDKINEIIENDRKSH